MYVYLCQDSNYPSTSLLITVLRLITTDALITQLCLSVIYTVHSLTQWRLLKHFRFQARNLTYQPLYQASHL